MNVLDRALHLSELALDRLRFDPEESDPEFRAHALAHLESCPECRHACERLEREDASFGQLDVPSAPVQTRLIAKGRESGVRPTSARTSTARPSRVGRASTPRRGRLAAILAVAAAIVAVVAIGFPEEPVDAPSSLVAASTPGRDDLRLDVAPFWELAGVRWPARSGDVRRTGAVLGFRPRVRDGGFLLIAEVRGDGTPLPVWPESGDAASVAENDAPIDIPQATTSQTLVAVLCLEAFRFVDLRFNLGPADAVSVVVDGKPSGCVSRVVSIEAPRALPETPTLSSRPRVTPPTGPRPIESRLRNVPNGAESAMSPCDRELGACIASGRPIRDCLASRGRCSSAKVPDRALVRPSADDDACAHVATLCRQHGGEPATCRKAEAECRSIRVEPIRATAKAATATNGRPSNATGTSPRVACEAFLAGCVATSTTVDSLRRCQRGYFACVGQSTGSPR